MNVSLTPELERLVDAKVSSGLYQTASEVVRDALRLLRERDKSLEDLRRDVRAGFEAAERGHCEVRDDRTTKALAAQIKSQGRKQLAPSSRRSSTR